MANPQPDKFTKISNEILEALCKINLSPYETRVLLFIFRKTYGYQKKSDRLALSQIAEGTGLAKPHICRALKSLTLRAIITQNGNKQLQFQKDYDFWQHTPRSKVTTLGNKPKKLPKQAPQKILRTSSISIDKYLEEVRGEFEGRLDIDEELKSFQLYYEDKPPKRPKLALRNWMKKAVEIRSEVTQTGNAVTQTGNFSKARPMKYNFICGECDHTMTVQWWNRPTKDYQECPECHLNEFHWDGKEGT